MKKLISKDLSRKILMIGEYFKHNAPGGMAAVLASYNEYFEEMRFVPTWRNGNVLLNCGMPFILMWCSCVTCR